jgi:hypothetical protein
MRETTRRVLSVLAAVLIVTTAAPMPTAATASAATGSTTATDDDCSQSVIGLVTGVVGQPLDPDNDSDGVGVDIYEAAVDPCYTQNNNVTDVDTKEEAQRRVAQLALEDRRFVERYFREFDANANRLENPAYLDGKTAFIAARKNGSTEVAAITEARSAVHERTAAQQRSLWRQYRSILQTMATLEAQAIDEQVRDTIIIKVVDSSGTTYSDMSLAGYRGHNATVNVTLTDGSEVRVPAPYKVVNGSVVTAHPLNDKIFIGVDNPETNKVQGIINEPKYKYTYTKRIDNPSAGTTVDVPSGGKIVLSSSATSSSGSGWVVGVETSSGDILGRAEHNNPLMTWGPSSDASSQYTKSDSTQATLKNLKNGGWSYAGVQGRSQQSNTLTVVKPQSGTIDWIDLYATPEVSGLSTREFKTRHQTIESKDNQVIDSLGDSTDGYLDSVDNNVQLGNINWSDSLTPLERYRMTAESSDVGEQSWLSAQYQQLGYGGGSLNSSVKIKVLAGSVVNGETLQNNETYNGTLFASASPPNETWVAGQQYTLGSSGDLPTGSVYLQVTTTTQRTEDGTIYYETNGKTISVNSGTIEVVSIRNDDGEMQLRIGHEAREPTNTNTSDLTNQINNLQDELRKLRDEIDEDNDGNNEDGGGAGTIDLGKFVPDGAFLGWFPSVEIPVAEASVNVVALAGITLVSGGAIVLTLYVGTSFFTFWLTVKRFFGFR